MSESSSNQNTSSQEICQSNSSYYSDLSETHTLSALSRHRRTLYSHSDSGISSSLPSDSCKYLTWNKIEQHDIQGSQLHCPRVREGPSEEELPFRQVRCTLPPKRRILEKTKRETWLQENWEDCMNLNISFQDLGDPYQVENFKRILRRLIRVETLWLMDNSLVDLSAIRLPSCRILNMNKNYLTSFKQLPKIPRIQHLSLAENHIETLAGLSSLQCTPLESLILTRNPCEFHQNYRKRCTIADILLQQWYLDLWSRRIQSLVTGFKAETSRPKSMVEQTCLVHVAWEAKQGKSAGEDKTRVFSCLPNLKMLDGILKLPEDCSSPKPKQRASFQNKGSPLIYGACSDHYKEESQLSSRRHIVREKTAVLSVFGISCCYTVASPPQSTL
ncbi:uncharacterized protein LOC104850007 isoform X1 [Fukomys damarensis]|uniref:uncharacterized protein LOC104850007 isoform X1 n=1 Tax=Fukomys damarensis TaxID=885580 RepID=UPI00053FC952|nr:uncharacterized protein LOC104850007 isoform X1 [Fukomys damarensis]